MKPSERLAFSPIEQRPPLKLPDGLRLIIWPVFALEHWDISRPMARTVISRWTLRPSTWVPWRLSWESHRM
jgi:allantoinase